MNYDIGILQPVDLAQPFMLSLAWDVDPSFDALQRINEVVGRFVTHAQHGAFRRVLPQGAPPPAAVLGGRSAQIAFSGFPFEKQALRPLVRALQYVYCREQILLRISLLSQVFANPNAAGHVVMGPADLVAPLTPVPTPFPARAIWCAKQVQLQMSFYASVLDATIDGFDDLVAAWVLFASDGAFARVEQMMSYDEDEDVDVCVDVPTVGDDFAEWMITSYGVGGECVTPLFNMLGSYNWAGNPPSQVVLEAG